MCSNQKSRIDRSEFPQVHQFELGPDRRAWRFVLHGCSDFFYSYNHPRYHDLSRLRQHESLYRRHRLRGHASEGILLDSTNDLSVFLLDCLNFPCSFCPVSLECQWRVHRPASRIFFVRSYRHRHNTGRRAITIHLTNIRADTRLGTRRGKLPKLLHIP